MLGIPRHGIPNMLQRQQTGTTLIHPSEILTVGEASHCYRQQGGSLTEPHTLDKILLPVTMTYCNKGTENLPSVAL